MTFTKSLFISSLFTSSWTVTWRSCSTKSILSQWPHHFGFLRGYWTWVTLHCHLIIFETSFKFCVSSSPYVCWIIRMVIFKKFDAILLFKLFRHYLGKSNRCWVYTLKHSLIANDRQSLQVRRPFTSPSEITTHTSFISTGKILIRYFSTNPVFFILFIVKSRKFDL